MHLPPCHFSFQFTVFKERLNCHLYQRSQDLCLGAPFNIASYALLTYMIAKLVGMQPGVLYTTVADAHIYETHTAGALEQIGREPFEFPRLEISGEQKSIDDFKYEDFKVVNYKSHDKIDMPIAI